MEGWYVRRLILDGATIRSNVYNDSLSLTTDIPLWDLSTNSYIFDIDIENILESNKWSVEQSFEENTLYQDLVELESKIKYLHDNNTLTEVELNILNLVFDGYIWNDIAKKLNKSRLIVTTMFNKTCAKLAFFLGKHFTNEGYINYMVKKHDLSFSQENFLRRYLNND